MNYIMDYSLPFFEKKGTICNIIEEDKNYIVYRYDTNGKKITLKVPKNSKNYNLLLENYYTDLKDYLDTNNNKYECYKKENLNKIKNSKITLLKLVSILLLVASISLLATSGLLEYIGFILAIVSVPTIISSIAISAKEKDRENKLQFINKYNELENKLKIYNGSKNKTIKLTQYTGLNPNNRNPKIDLKKVKVLETKRTA